MFSKAKIIFLAMMSAGLAEAYNDNHRPFPSNAWPEIIESTQIADSSETPITGENEIPVVFRVSDSPENSENPDKQFRIYGDGELFYVEFSVAGQEMIPRTAFGHQGCTSLFRLFQADLNLDGKSDYVLSAWASGLGLASGYNYDAFFLSSSNGYKLTPITSLWSDSEDYVLIDGKPCIIHTSVDHMDEDCNDGKKHNFWVYNLLGIEGDEIHLANHLHHDFPKIIWFSFAPNHDETTLLTDEQKEKIQQRALEQIYWKP